MKYELENTTRAPVTVFSEDGDSIQLPIGRHVVPEKFNWNLPAGVRQPRNNINSSVEPENENNSELLREEMHAAVVDKEDDDNVSEATNSKFNTGRRR